MEEPMKETEQKITEIAENFSIEEIEFSDVLLMDDDTSTCGDYNL